MGAAGSSLVDFGAFPGTDSATVAVTGQGAILSNSKVEAYLDAATAATADHSSDEHVAESGNISVLCQNVIAGTGFTIIAQANGKFRMYGKWNVSWVWV
jgi:hypothetical protein